MACEVMEGYKVEVESPDKIQANPSWFRVWHKAPEFMRLITDDNPDIIRNMHVGDRVSLKYFEEDCARPSAQLETVIRKISKGEKGSIRGKYVVDVEILTCRSPGGLTAFLH